MQFKILTNIEIGCTKLGIFIIDWGQIRLDGRSNNKYPTEPESESKRTTSIRVPRMEVTPHNRIYWCRLVLSNVLTFQ